MKPYIKEIDWAEKVIWLPRGIDLEEANEHADDIYCFVRRKEDLHRQRIYI